MINELELGVTTLHTAEVSLSKVLNPKQLQGHSCNRPLTFLSAPLLHLQQQHVTLNIFRCGKEPVTQRE